jgi:hypothetical protein
VTNRRWSLFLLVALAAGCASSDPNAKNPSTAEVAVAAITPAAGSQVQQSTVVEATVAYTISRFHARADSYYLVTEFEGTNGKLFHDYERLGDEPILVGAHGSLIVTHTLSKAWADPRLKKPIRLSFTVVAHIGPNDSVVIGRSAPVEYAAK